MTNPLRNAYIALGANLGDRRGTLNDAIALLSENPCVEVLSVSSFHETEPVGGPPNQPKYLNAAAHLQTSLDPRELLNLLLATEKKLGRDRSSPERNLPRTVDLDILFYESEIINTPELILPHPRLHERIFVLAPLNEIAPKLEHPVLKRSVSEMLAQLRSAMSL